MSYEATVQNIAAMFETFWLGSMKRVQKMRAKLAVPGGYTANDLATDVAGWWVESADFAFSFFPASDALIVVALEDQLSGAGSFSASGSAYLEKPAPTAGLVSTDLVWIGNPATLAAGAVTVIPAANVAVTADPTSVSKIQVDAIWTNANLVTGTYHGIVREGTTPLAMTVLVLY